MLFVRIVVRRILGGDGGIADRTSDDNAEAGWDCNARPGQ